jgi:hypothetical protein
MVHFLKSMILRGVNEITDGDQSLKLRHFIFCFYEEIIEVLAEELEFKDLP